jgi:hypothetical protein
MGWSSQEYAVEVVCPDRYIVLPSAQQTRATRYRVITHRNPLLT